MFKKPTPSQIHLMKKTKNHFYHWKISKIPKVPWPRNFQLLYPSSPLVPGSFHYTAPKKYRGGNPPGSNIPPFYSRRHSPSRLYIPAMIQYTANNFPPNCTAKILPESFYHLSVLKNKKITNLKKINKLNIIVMVKYKRKTVSDCEAASCPSRPKWRRSRGCWPTTRGKSTSRHGRSGDELPNFTDGWHSDSNCLDGGGRGRGGGAELGIWGLRYCSVVLKSQF